MKIGSDGGQDSEKNECRGDDRRQTTHSLYNLWLITSMAIRASYWVWHDAG